jgi:hypothetical protein
MPAAMNVATIEWTATINIWAFRFHFGQLRGSPGGSGRLASICLWEIGSVVTSSKRIELPLSLFFGSLGAEIPSPVMM